MGNMSIILYEGQNDFCTGFLGLVAVPLVRAPGSQSGDQGFEPSMVHHLLFFHEKEK